MLYPGPSLHELSLDEIARGCAEDQRMGRAHERGYCLELFCRAIDGNDNLAWDFITAQFGHLVLDWVYLFWHGISDDTAEEVAQVAFVKFIQNHRKHAIPVRFRFPHVGALLSVLKTCAFTSAIDRQRAEAREPEFVDLPEELVPGEASQNGGIGLDTIDVKQLTEVIMAWVNQNLTPLERKAFRLTYIYKLKPAEIVTHYPKEFADARAIYVIRERVVRQIRLKFGAIWQDVK
jgi:DNA-directed RNA polymerase specialized sigma24 family protein